MRYRRMKNSEYAFVDLSYYKRISKRASAKQRDKGLEFVNKGCVKFVLAERAFECYPIRGYNSTVYTMMPDSEGHVSCSCQWHRAIVKSRKAAICSHVFALYVALRSGRRLE